jgi:hypothetical protein
VILGFQRLGWFCPSRPCCHICGPTRGDSASCSDRANLDADRVRKFDVAEWEPFLPNPTCNDCSPQWHD